MNEPTAFVLMPFDASFDEIYNLFIVDALSEAGINSFRADDIQSQQSILKDIVASIDSSDLIIADLTGNNPNVFYELGLAHAFGKKVILLTQDVAELPFDLRPYRVVSYSTHFSAIHKAKKDLMSLAKGAIDGSTAFGSPIADYRGSQSRRHTESTPTRQGHDSTDDRGLLDHMVDVEEGTGELEAVIEEATAHIREIGSTVESFSNQVTVAKATPSAGTAAHIRKLARRLAKDISTFTEHIARTNQDYTAVLSRIKDSLEFIVTFHRPVTTSERDELAAAREQLIAMETAAEYARSGLSSLDEGMAMGEGLERHLTRSIRESRIEINQFIDNIDQTIAMVARARGAADDMLGL